MGHRARHHLISTQVSTKLQLNQLSLWQLYGQTVLVVKERQDRVVCHRDQQREVFVLGGRFRTLGGKRALSCRIGSPRLGEVMVYVGCVNEGREVQKVG